MKMHFATLAGAVLIAMGSSTAFAGDTQCRGEKCWDLPDFQCNGGDCDSVGNYAKVMQFGMKNDATVLQNVNSIENSADRKSVV